MFEREDPAVLETFWEAMHSLSGFTARTLGDVIDLDAATRLLDVGGGSGAFAIELCRRYPSLCATVFDLPHVIDIAADKIADAELRDRIAVHGGDFFADALPPGHDVHLYSMIMHDWNQEHDRLLLRKSFDALPNTGMIIISELLVDDDKSGPATRPRDDPVWYRAIASAATRRSTSGTRERQPVRSHTAARTPSHGACAAEPRTLAGVSGMPSATGRSRWASSAELDGVARSPSVSRGRGGARDVRRALARPA